MKHFLTVIGQTPGASAKNVCLFPRVRSIKLTFCPIVLKPNQMTHTSYLCSDFNVKLFWTFLYATFRYTVQLQNRLHPVGTLTVGLVHVHVRPRPQKEQLLGSHNATLTSLKGNLFFFFCPQSLVMAQFKWNYSINQEAHLDIRLDQTKTLLFVHIFCVCWG